jgi:hypothetical protein
LIGCLSCRIVSRSLSLRVGWKSGCTLEPSGSLDGSYQGTSAIAAGNWPTSHGGWQL